jgi:hypothetical protein
MRRHTIGGVLGDERGSRGSARALRDALRVDPSGVRAAEVMRAGVSVDLAQLPLWPDAAAAGGSGEAVEQGGLAEPAVGPQHFGAPGPLAVGGAVGGRREGDPVPAVVELVVERAVLAGQDHGGPGGV